MNELNVKGWQAESLRQARRAATVELVQVDLFDGGYETAAFEVAVNGVILGRWFRTKSKGCKVNWQSGIGGRPISVPDNGDDHSQIIAAIRPAIPPVQLLRPGPGGRG